MHCPSNPLGAVVSIVQAAAWGGDRSAHTSHGSRGLTGPSVPVFRGGPGPPRACPLLQSNLTGGCALPKATLGARSPQPGPPGHDVERNRQPVLWLPQAVEVQEGPAQGQPGHALMVQPQSSGGPLAGGDTDRGQFFLPSLACESLFPSLSGEWGALGLRWGLGGGGVHTL